MIDHPITPPQELVQEWVDTYFGGKISQSNFHVDLATRAAQWGADCELDACCDALNDINDSRYWSGQLRAARRPKPPSLKEQALEALERQCLRSISPLVSTSDLDTIRRALEALPND
jgi:predicted HD phosphohydrolase